MHDDDLRTTLLELTEPRPEPVDPAAGVSRRIRRIRRRRQSTFAVTLAAVVTAATLAAVPALEAIRSGADPGVSGSSPTVRPSSAPKPTKATTPTTTPTMNDPRRNAKLPPPWKDRVFTKFPERNLYAPQAIYLAEGTLNGHRWAALTHSPNMLSEGCIGVVSEAREFGLDGCFDEWPAGRRADWLALPAYEGKKPNMTMLNATLVGGAVSADARTVVIKTRDGKEYRTPAVGTPTSDKLRFFFYVVPQRDAKVTEVRPLDAGDAPADPPVGLSSTGGQCYVGPREGYPNGVDVCTELTPAR